MNPDAIEWLESLSEADHANVFVPSLPCVGAKASSESFFSVKPGHEPCIHCQRAEMTRSLTVIG